MGVSSPAWTAETAFPRTWETNDFKLGPWSLYQIWPAHPDSGANYVPLVFKDEK